MSDKLMTATELAEYLNVPKCWVYNHTSTEEIPVIKVGHYNRYNLKDVLEALKETND